MAIMKREGTKFWWYSVCRGKGLPRLRGSTGKTDRKEAEAVEQVVRMAFSGKTPAQKLHAMIDAITGTSHVGLPLAGVWEVYDGWMVSAGHTLSDMTKRNRRRAVERFVAWTAEHRPAVACAGEVDRACAAAFAAWLHGQGAGGKTRRNLIADLGTVWEGLRRVRDDVKDDPWPLVLPKNDSERLDAFTAEEEKAVLKAADDLGHGWGLACRISRFTGLRYGDVAQLRWEMVDLEAGVIRLTPAKTARHGIGVVLPICEALGAALRAGKEVSGSSLEYVLPDHALAYPKPEKGAPGPFSAVLLKAEVNGRHTFHSWRHTFRTRLAAAGVSDEIAKRLGGWTVDQTAMRYDHDGRLKELREAVEKGAGPVGGKKKAGGRSRPSPTT